MADLVTSKISSWIAHCWVLTMCSCDLFCMCVCVEKEHKLSNVSYKETNSKGLGPHIYDLI